MLRHRRNLSHDGVKINLRHQLIHLKEYISVYHLMMWTLRAPVSYFKFFWKYDLNVLLAEQTNIYNVQKSGSSLSSTAEVIEQFIGIQIYMSIIDFPNFSMYWANETRYSIIADIT